MLQEAAIRDFVEKAKEEGCFVFDVEHDPNTDPTIPGFALWGCGFCVGDSHFYLPSNDRSIELLRELFSLDLIPVGHNIKYDLKCVRACGITPKELPKTAYCTMVAINLLEDNRNYSKIGLKTLVKEFYDHQMTEFKDASAEGGDTEKFHQYGEEDVIWTWRLWKDLEARLREEDLFKLFEKILGPSSLLFADVELKGIHWDQKKANELYYAFTKIAEDTKNEFLDFVGHDINMRSPVQLAARVFGDMKIPTDGLAVSDKTGKAGLNEDNIIILSKKYPQFRPLRAYRTAMKQIDSYLDPMSKNARERDGRVHTTFWITSSTGRTRSTSPSIQTVTSRWSVFIRKYFEGLNIKECFTSPEGFKLLCVDFSQIELRIIAHITKDPTLLKAYRDYQCTCCGIKGSSKTILHTCPKCGAGENEDILTDDSALGFYHGLDLHAMTANSIEALGGDRDAGKTGNFSIVYGASPYTLNSRHPKLSVNKWRQASNQYLYEKHPKIGAWHQASEVKLKTYRVCKDLFGRKRRFTKKDIMDSPRHSFNQFINFSPQATASELMQLCASKIRDKLIDLDLWFDKATIVNAVHDELLLEVADEHVDEVAALVQDTMENTAKFIVPLRADVKAAKDWATAK